MSKFKQNYKDGFCAEISNKKVTIPVEFIDIWLV